MKNEIEQQAEATAAELMKRLPAYSCGTPAMANGVRELLIEAFKAGIAEYPIIHETNRESA